MKLDLTEWCQLSGLAEDRASKKDSASHKKGDRKVIFGAEMEYMGKGWDPEHPDSTWKRVGPSSGETAKSASSSKPKAEKAIADALSKDEAFNKTAEAVANAGGEADERTSAELFMRGVKTGAKIGAAVGGGLALAMGVAASAPVGAIVAASSLMALEAGIKGALLGGFVGGFQAYRRDKEKERAQKAEAVGSQWPLFEGSAGTINLGRTPEAVRNNVARMTAAAFNAVKVIPEEEWKDAEKDKKKAAALKDKVRTLTQAALLKLESTKAVAPQGKTPLSGSLTEWRLLSGLEESADLDRLRRSAELGDSDAERALGRAIRRSGLFGITKSHGLGGEWFMLEPWPGEPGHYRLHAGDDGRVSLTWMPRSYADDDQPPIREPRERLYMGDSVDAAVAVAERHFRQHGRHQRSEHSSGGQTRVDDIGIDVEF